jgi:hypothetical protein
MENPDYNPDNPTSGAGGGGGGGLNLQPIPNMAGAMYDPATGDLYDVNGNKVAGHYDPATQNLTDPTGAVRHVTGTGAPPTPGQTGPYTTPYTAPTAAPPATGGGGGGGGSNTSGGPPNPFNVQPFQPPTPLGLPNTPSFTPPSYTPPPPFSYPKFEAPTAQDALNTPGYQFPLQQGLSAISNTQAAQGLWNTGATGKAFQDYAQNYASQFYNNVYNQALNSYMANASNAMNTYATNAETQYLQPYSIAFQNAQAAFAPQMTGYQTNAQNIMNWNQQNYNNSLAAWNDLFNQRLGTADFLHRAATS